MTNDDNSDNRTSAPSNPGEAGRAFGAFVRGLSWLVLLLHAGTVAKAGRWTLWARHLALPAWFPVLLLAALVSRIVLLKNRHGNEEALPAPFRPGWFAVICLVLIGYSISLDFRELFFVANPP